MKKNILLILMSIMLLGCNPLPNDNTSSTREEPTSPTTSEDPNTSTVTTEPTTDDTIPDTSEEPVVPMTDLSEIRSLGLTFQNLVNDVGVYTSNKPATFTAQLLAAQDYITTQKGYGDRYMAYVANETGYITLNMTYAYYENLNKYHENQDVYEFSGKIGLYNDEVVVVLSKKPTHLPNVSLTYNLSDFAIARDNLTNFITNVKALKRNSKGIAFNPTPATYTLKYVVDVKNTIALFTDGTHYVKMHSHEKINNLFTPGSVYDLIVREGSFYYYAEFEYLQKKNSSVEIVEDYSNATITTAKSLYDYFYDDEKGKENALVNMNYMDISASLFYFEGYVNVYFKYPNYSIVFDDTSKADYGTYINARDGKALFANNDNSASKSLTSLEKYSPFYEYTFPVEGGSKPKIGFYFTPYRMSPEDYWQIQVFANTIIEL